jgi:hypothetical protein
MNCRTCTRTNLRREDFCVLRDGKWILVPQCRHCYKEEQRFVPESPRAHGSTATKTNNQTLRRET